MAKKMKAAIFVQKGRIVLDDKPIPDIGPNDALMRVTTTTICGTDVHILKGEYPVAKGLTIGHEPVGIIEKLGSGVSGFKEGQRVIAGAITPSGWSHACLCGCGSQDGAGTKHGWQAIGGWKFGNTIDGCQAEYVRVPDAMANLAPVDDGVSDEQVLMCPDIMSTGFAGAETGEIKIGDTVAIFAQGPIGLCATAGAKLMGATQIIGVDTIPARLQMAKRMGADVVVDFKKENPVEAIMRLTDGRGVDVAIEALGTQSTFESALRVLRPGGVLSSLGVFVRSAYPARCFRRWARQQIHSQFALPRWQGTDASDVGSNCIRSRRLRQSRHASFQARADRRSVRPLCQSTRRCSEGGHYDMMNR